MFLPCCRHKPRFTTGTFWAWMLSLVFLLLEIAAVVVLIVLVRFSVRVWSGEVSEVAAHCLAVATEAHRLPQRRLQTTQLAAAAVTMIPSPIATLPSVEVRAQD